MSWAADDAFGSSALFRLISAMPPLPPDSDQIAKATLNIRRKPHASFALIASASAGRPSNEPRQVPPRYRATFEQPWTINRHPTGRDRADVAASSAADKPALKCNRCTFFRRQTHLRLCIGWANAAAGPQNSSHPGKNSQLRLAQALRKPQSNERQSVPIE
jgi:hypothetical protein